MEQQFIRNIGIYTDDEMDKIIHSKIGIVGLGCTGCIIAEFLARVGVTNFILVDGDSYDLTNINRQINATHSTLGKNKAVSTSERILEINKNCNVNYFPEFLTLKNAEDILKPCSFIVNGLDDPYTMVILHRTARKLKTDSIFLLSGVVPFQGIISILKHDNPIDYETLMNIPTKGLPLDINTMNLRKELFEKVTSNRLRNALKRGAISGEWVSQRERGGPMISNGITSNIVGLIAVNEIIKTIICRPTLKYVEAPNILYFDGAKNIMEERKPDGDNFWFQGDF